MSDEKEHIQRMTEKNKVVLKGDMPEHEIPSSSSAPNDPTISIMRLTVNTEANGDPGLCIPTRRNSPHMDNDEACDRKKYDLA